MDSLISIIVPIYNVEKYVDECIESIVNQVYSNIEIILVDDGSPDNCPMICDSWAKKDKRIKVIHKQNGGLSDARNAGLDHAIGQYIVFVDSDDYIDKEMLLVLYETMIKSNSDIVMCNKATVTTKEITFAENDGGILSYSGDEILDNFLYHKNSFCSGIWNKLFRRELFEGVRFPKGLTTEDYYVYSFVYSRATKFTHIKRVLYYYRVRKGSILHSELNEQSFHKIEIADMVYENLNNINCENRRGMNYFKMQAYHDVLNALIKRSAPKKIIKEYARKLRKFYFSIITDAKVSIDFKMKYTIFCCFPLKYTSFKNKFLKQSYEKEQEGWFE